ncbi:hypothetical protein CH339_05850 [Rhodobium orientis]|uniref:SPOR domain-containing protein n=1 Tax=Rhodobium orientis TaxID=34017 RepID=A0A327JQT2_9HYPH|nr:hypothetical protein [Rhodobium orientis]RAI28647.1 hypothetical protein CH339_05850 [Rhodobium orientis]
MVAESDDRGAGSSDEGVKTDTGSLYGGFSDQEDGPDGFTLAGWGFTAVLAFVFAYAAWQFGALNGTSLAELPPAGDVVITGSTRSTQPLGTFSDNANADAPITEVTTVEADVLRREIAELRRTVIMVRDINDRLQGRVDRLEAELRKTAGLRQPQTSREMAATPSDAAVPKAEKSGLDIAVRPFDPVKELPKVAAAPAEKPAESAKAPPAQQAAAAVSPPAAKPAETKPVRVIMPGPTAAAAPPPQRVAAAPTTAPEVNGPEKVVEIDRPAVEVARAPAEVDDPVTTGSIRAPERDKLVPRAKPRLQPVSLPPDPAPEPSSEAADKPETSQLSQSRFGIDLGGYKSLTELRMGWSSFSQNNPALAGDLEPLASMSERDGTLEARLVVGPFVNANDAVRACAKLMSSGNLCQPTLFSGQALRLP